MIFEKYRRLLPYAKPFRIKFIFATIFNLLSAFLEPLSIVSLLPALNIILGEGGKQSSALTGISIPGVQIVNKQGILDWFTAQFTSGTKDEALLKIAVFLFVVYALKNILQYIGSYFMMLFEGGMSKSIRDAVFEKLTSLSIDYFYDRKSGQLLVRVTDDVGNVNATISSSITTLIREPIQILTILFFLFSISPMLSLVAIGMALLSLVLINFFGSTLKAYAHKLQYNVGNFLSVAQETISGIKVVKSFGMEKYEVSRFTDETKRHFQISRRLSRIRNMINPLNETIAITGFIVILWYGGHQVFEKQMKGSELLSFLPALIYLMQPVRSLSNVFGRLHEGTAAAENVFTVLDAIPSVASGIEIAPMHITRPIEFENVHFSYKNSNAEAIAGITLTIEPNKVLALVGPSGAGKTTFVDLIARFYDPSEGRIMLEGRDLRSYDLVSLRKLFGIVTQDTVLFHDTIFNNICYGKRSATREEVIEAAKASNAHEFIMASPLGYDSIVGDRGVRMSGGQRQRIAIARALVKNPPILIFDEATSALDTENEMLVQEAIERLLKERTAIVIAHRLSTIQNADMIAVFDKGKIVETGTHEKLIHDENGLYNRLYTIQIGTGIENVISTIRD